MALIVSQAKKVNSPRGVDGGFFDLFAERLELAEVLFETEGQLARGGIMGALDGQVLRGSSPRLALRERAGQNSARA